MNRGLALQGIGTLAQGKYVLATKYKSDLGGTYVDSAIYNSWMAKARAFLKLFLEDDNEFLIGYVKINVQDEITYNRLCSELL